MPTGSGRPRGFAAPTATSAARVSSQDTHRQDLDAEREKEAKARPSWSASTKSKGPQARHPSVSPKKRHASPPMKSTATTDAHHKVPPLALKKVERAPVSPRAEPTDMTSGELASKGEEDAAAGQRMAKAAAAAAKAEAFLMMNRPDAHDDDQKDSPRAPRERSVSIHTPDDKGHTAATATTNDAVNDGSGDGEEEDFTGLLATRQVGDARGLNVSPPPSATLREDSVESTSHQRPSPPQRRSPPSSAHASPEVVTRVGRASTPASSTKHAGDDAQSANDAGTHNGGALAQLKSIMERFGTSRSPSVGTTPTVGTPRTGAADVSNGAPAATASSPPAAAKKEGAPSKKTPAARKSKSPEVSQPAKKPAPKATARGASSGRTSSSPEGRKAAPASAAGRTAGRTATPPSASGSKAKPKEAVATEPNVKAERLSETAAVAGCVAERSDSPNPLGETKTPSRARGRTSPTDHGALETALPIAVAEERVRTSEVSTSPKPRTPARRQSASSAGDAAAVEVKGAGVKSEKKKAEPWSRPSNRGLTSPSQGPAKTPTRTSTPSAKSTARPRPTVPGDVANLGAKGALPQTKAPPAAPRYVTASAAPTATAEPAVPTLAPSAPLTTSIQAAKRNRDAAAAAARGAGASSVVSGAATPLDLTMQSADNDGAAGAEASTAVAVSAAASNPDSVTPPRTQRTATARNDSLAQSPVTADAMSTATGGSFRGDRPVKPTNVPGLRRLGGVNIERLRTVAQCDGKWDGSIYAADRDGAIVRRCIIDGEPLPGEDVYKTIFYRHNCSGCTALRIIGHLLWAGFDDGCVRVFDADAPLYEAVRHRSAVTAIEVAPDGFVYTASSDWQMYQWDTSQGHLHGRPFASHSSGIRSLASVPAVGLGHEALHVLASLSATAAGNTDGSASATNTAAFSGALISGSEDGEVRVWPLFESDAAPRMRTPNRARATQQTQPSQSPESEAPTQPSSRPFVVLTPSHKGTVRCLAVSCAPPPTAAAVLSPLSTPRTAGMPSDPSSSSFGDTLTSTSKPAVVFSGGDDGFVFAWSMGTLTCLSETSVGASGVSSLTSTGSSVWAMSKNGTAVAMDSAGSGVVSHRVTLAPQPPAPASGPGKRAPVKNSSTLHAVTPLIGHVLWATDGRGVTTAWHVADFSLGGESHELSAQRRVSTSASLRPMSEFEHEELATALAARVEALENRAVQGLAAAESEYLSTLSDLALSVTGAIDGNIAVAQDAASRDEELTTLLSTKDDEIAQLKDDVARAETAKDDALITAGDAAVAFENLQNDYDALSKQSASKDAEIAELKSELAAALATAPDQAALVEAMEAAAVAKREATEAQARIEELKASFETAAAEQEAAHATQMKDAAVEIASLEATIADMDAELAAAKQDDGQVSQRRTEELELAAANEKIAALEEALVENEKALEQSLEDCAAESAKVADLEVRFDDAVSEAVSRALDGDGRHNESVALADAKAVKDRAVRELSMAHGTIDALQSELEQLREQLEISVCEANNTHMSEHLSPTSDLDVVALKEDLHDALERESAALEALQESTHSPQKSLERDAAIGADTIAAMEAQIEDLEGQLEDLQAQLHEAAAAKVLADQATAEANALALESETSRRQLEEEFQRTKEELAVVTSELEHTKQSLSEFEKSFGDCLSSGNTPRPGQASLQHLADHGDGPLNPSDLAAENRRLKAEIDEKDATIAKLNASDRDIAAALHRIREEAVVAARSESGGKRSTASKQPKCGMPGHAKAACIWCSGGVSTSTGTTLLGTDRRGPVAGFVHPKKAQMYQEAASMSMAASRIDHRSVSALSPNGNGGTALTDATVLDHHRSHSALSPRDGFVSPIPIPKQHQQFFTSPRSTSMNAHQHASITSFTPRHGAGAFVKSAVSHRQQLQQQAARCSPSRSALSVTSASGMTGRGVSDGRSQSALSSTTRTKHEELQGSIARFEQVLGDIEK